MERISICTILHKINFEFTELNFCEIRDGLIIKNEFIPKYGKTGYLNKFIINDIKLFEEELGYLIRYVRSVQEYLYYYCDNISNPLFGNLKFRFQTYSDNKEFEKLDGIILPINHHFWNNYLPPLRMDDMSEIRSTDEQPTLIPNGLPDIKRKDCDLIDLFKDEISNCINNNCTSEENIYEIGSTNSGIDLNGFAEKSLLQIFKEQTGEDPSEKEVKEIMAVFAEESKKKKAQGITKWVYITMVIIICSIILLAIF